MIRLFGLAVHDAGRQQRGHAVAGGLAAIPLTTIGGKALLGQFGRIKTKQANAGPIQPEAVAITDPRLPCKRRRRRVERCRQPGNGSQHDDRQQCAAPAAEDGNAIQLQTSYFTPR